MNEQDREMTQMVVDLGANRRGELNEIFLRTFGKAVQFMMRAMFGDESAIPVKIKGNKREIQSFAKTMGREKKYMKTAAKYGLNNPKTYKSKYKLRKAAADFEKTTGIKWPFKG